MQDAATSVATRLDSDVHHVVEYQLRNIVRLLDGVDDGVDLVLSQSKIAYYGV